MGRTGFGDALTVAVGLLVGLGTFFGRLDRAVRRRWGLDRA